jgi:serine/threonine-protein kinase ULK4
MNNYHFYEEIGKSNHSVVYKARKKKSLEYFAIKSNEKTRKERVLNEVKVSMNLNHPNILKLHTYYETKNHFWAIYEYCVGGDLYSLLQND